MNKKMAYRMDKVDELVKREVAKELRLLFPDEMVSVTEVEVSKDLSSAKIWLSAFSNPEAIVDDANNHAKAITRILASRLIMKKIPRLTFFLDKRGDHAERIEHLIDQISKESEKNE